MQISGQATVFATERDSSNGKWYTYQIGVSSKKEDGSYVNAYIDAMFRRGVVVENKSRINIKDGFLTVREFMKNDGTKQKKLSVMILDFDMADGFTVHAEEHEQYTALNYDDVPF